MTTPYDLPAPFIHRVTARDEDLDVFRHVNHAVYMRWLQDAAWAHSRADGVDEAVCEAQDRGMALVRAEVEHLAHGRAGDALEVLVWITAVERVRAKRYFQILRPDDRITLLRAHWNLACFDLTTGKPARIGAAFLAHYRVNAHVAECLDDDSRPRTSNP